MMAAFARLARGRPSTLRGIALVACCACGLSVAPAGAGASAQDSDGFELSLAHPRAEQLIVVDGTGSGRAQFVQVDVTQVTNPDRVPLSFAVHFRNARGDDAELGTFSLFPADNPGRFIVPTQGKVHGRGHLIVTLAALERPTRSNGIVVTLKPLTLLRE